MDMVFLQGLCASLSLTYFVLAITLLEATGGVNICFESAGFSVSFVFPSHFYSSSSPLPLAA